jgi:hypothetical protein
MGQTYISVGIFQAVIDGTEKIRSTLNIFHGKGLIDLLDALASLRQIANCVIVIMTARDSFLENGWIRGQAADPIL